LLSAPKKKILPESLHHLHSSIQNGKSYLAILHLGLAHSNCKFHSGLVTSGLEKVEKHSRYVRQEIFGMQKVTAYLF